LYIVVRMFEHEMRLNRTPKRYAVACNSRGLTANFLELLTPNDASTLPICRHLR